MRSGCMYITPDWSIEINTPAMYVQLLCRRYVFQRVSYTSQPTIPKHKVEVSSLFHRVHQPTSGSFCPLLLSFIYPPFFVVVIDDWHGHINSEQNDRTAPCYRLFMILEERWYHNTIPQSVVADKHSLRLPKYFDQQKVHWTLGFPSVPSDDVDGVILRRGRPVGSRLHVTVGPSVSSSVGASQV